MFKTKLITSLLVFFIFLIITSIIKNKTRVIEKQIFNLKTKIFSKEKDLNETQLDFYYLTSPREIENKLNIIGFHNYQPIEHSKIFYSITDFINIENKIREVIEYYQIDFKSIGQPLRLLITGSLFGPSLSKIIKVLGLEKTIKRINR